MSILSPRKIPILFKIFEKADGDLSSLQNKNYSKDPRHLVLLKGYSLKERPISPLTGTANQNSSNLNMPSPLSTATQNMLIDSSHMMANQNNLLRGNNGPPGQLSGQQPINPSYQGPQQQQQNAQMGYNNQMAQSQHVNRYCFPESNKHILFDLKCNL